MIWKFIYHVYKDAIGFYFKQTVPMLVPHKIKKKKMAKYDILMTY